MILDEIARQVGGAAEGAAGGLAGKMDTLTYRWREFKESLAAAAGASKLAAAGIDTISRSLEHMSNMMMPDVTKSIENEIAGLENRLKMFERLGGSGGAGGAVAKINARIQTLKNSLEELRNPTGDLSIDYGNLNETIDAGTISTEQAAKAARELELQIKALDDAISASNANPWDPIGYDIDSGGIDEVAAAIQKIELERNNHRLETLRNIAVQQGIKDTYTDQGDPMAGLEEDFDYMVELSQNTAAKMEDNFSDFFYNFKDGVGDLGDLWDSLVNSIWRAWSDLMGQMAREWAFGKDGQGDGWLSAVGTAIADWFSTDANVAHSGGIVGESNFRQRQVNPIIFAGAPRLHSGLAPDEFPAILQKGEAVIPRDKVKKAKNDWDGGNVVVIINEAPAGTQAKMDTSTPGLKKIVIDIGAADILNGGKLDRVLRQTYGLGRATIGR